MVNMSKIFNKGGLHGNKAREISKRPGQSDA